MAARLENASTNHRRPLITKEELFRMSVDLTGQFIANRDIGGRTHNPEDTVHDYIVSIYQTVERAWLEVGADEHSRGM
jgi:hypothetical protein